MAMPAAQLRPVPPIAPVRDQVTQQRARAHVVHVMTVVLAAADRNHGSPEQGAQTQQGAAEVAPGIHRPALAVVHPGPSIETLTRTAVLPAAAAADYKQPHLAGQEEAQVAQPGEAEAAVAAGEAPPAVVQHVVARLGADVDADQLVLGGAGGGLATGDEVGPRAANRVLDRVGQEAGEDERDGEPEDGDMVLVPRGAC